MKIILSDPVKYVNGRVFTLSDGVKKFIIPVCFEDGFIVKLMEFRYSGEMLSDMQVWKRQEFLT